MSKFTTYEILNLLRSHLYGDVLHTLRNNVDEAVEITGYTVLMYATAYQDNDAINFFLENKANPFKEDKYGNTAFSIAFQQGMEDTAKNFVLYKKSLASLTEEYNDLAVAVSNQKEGYFSYFIAYHICKTDSTLRDFLGLDVKGAICCYTHAKDYYEILGEDSSSLLSIDNISSNSSFLIEI